MFKRLLTIMICALFIAAVSARADDWSKKTVVTFSAPVEIPGVILPAGKYVFRLLDSLADRHIVQVFNEDETQIFATILAIPNYRLEPTGETVLHFTERPRNMPVALRAWFYPGDSFGQEFVYPKARATAIAEEIQAPVLWAPVTAEEKPEEIVNAPVETVAPPEKSALWNAPEPTPLTVEPTVEPVPVVEAAPPPPPTPEPELPETASAIPLIALLGVSFLGAAAILKRVLL